jgi:hypothetical protein
MKTTFSALLGLLFLCSPVALAARNTFYSFSSEDSVHVVPNIPLKDMRLVEYSHRALDVDLPNPQPLVGQTDDGWFDESLMGMRIYYNDVTGKVDTLPPTLGILGNEIASVGRAQSVLKKLIQTGNFLKKLMGGDLVSFPVGLSKTIGNATYTVAIGGMVLKPTYAELEVYVQIDIPDRATPLMFGVRDLKFSRDAGIVGETSIGLLEDFTLQLNEQGKAVLFLEKMDDYGEGSATANAETGTYVTVDCDGFKELSLKGSVKFDRDWLIPINASTGQALPEPNLVQGTFETKVKSWDELYLELDFTPFAIHGLEDVAWNVDKVVFDFSDEKSPTGVAFPKNYFSPFVSGGSPSPLWRGFYMQKFEVILPRKFEDENKQPFRIMADNVIIDDMGFTGSVALSPVIPLDKGNMGGWSFSMDEFRVSIIAQQFEDVSFRGLVNVPLFRGAEGGDSTTVTRPDCFEYRAYINPGNQYRFSVANKTTLKVPLWVADATILPNSKLEIAMDSVGGFTTMATLYGSISIDGNFGGGQLLEIPDVTFTELVVRNKAPYLSVKKFGLSGELGVGFAGFNLTISGVGLVNVANEPNKKSLKFEARVNLTPSSEYGLTAMGAFRLIGKMDVVESRQKWIYERFKVDGVCLSGSFPGVDTLGGCIYFYEENATYGTGFRGSLKVRFSKIDFGLDAVAQFGRKKRSNGTEYKYFLVDAMVYANIPLPPLTLKAIGGGAYYHMNRVDEFAQLTVNGTNPNQSQGWFESSLGQSLSGIKYEPDDSTSLGLKLTTMMELGKGNLVNVNATFEISFNSKDSLGNGGGVKEIRLYGAVKIMEESSNKFVAKGDYDKASNKNAVNGGAKVTGYINIGYNFNENHFFASADLYVNMGSVRGGYEGDFANYAGGLSFDANRDGWVFNLGKGGMANDTMKEIRLKVGIPGVADNLALLTAYFVVGTKGVPTSFPALPSWVQSMLGYGSTASSYNNRPSSALKEGRGLAFGATFQVGYKFDRNGIPIYVDFKLGVGFDISVIDYGESATCGVNGPPVGINGWYAKGRLWVAVQGSMGLKWRKKRFAIVEGSFGAILEAELPKPFWAKGKLVGQVKILKFIKVKWKFNLEIGDRCDIVGAEVESSVDEVVASIVPGNNSTDISGAILPTVNFNLPIGEVVDGEDDEGNAVAYKASLVSLELLKQGASVPNTWTYNAEKDVITMLPTNYLAPSSEYVVRVRTKLEEKVGNNWVVVKTDDGNDVDEKLATFKTGNSRTIPVENIVFNYPRDKQYNFYKDEHSQNKGYIQLRRGQGEFFRPPFQVTAKIENLASGQIVEVPVTADSEGKYISFPLEGLDNNVIYKLALVSSQSTGGFGGSGSGLPPTEIYTIHFRTSKFNTFQQKMESFRRGPNELNYTMETPELFDDYELLGYQGQRSSVSVEAAIGIDDVKLLEGDWLGIRKKINFLYSNFPLKHLYQYYAPVDIPGIGLSPSRNVAYGAPPLNAAKLVNGIFGRNAPVPESVILTDAQIADATPNTMWDSMTAVILYEFYNVAKQDFGHVQAQCRALLSEFYYYYCEDQVIYIGGDGTSSEVGGQNDQTPVSCDTNTHWYQDETFLEFCGNDYAIIGMSGAYSPYLLRNPNVLGRLDNFSIPNAMPSGKYGIKLKYFLPGQTSPSSEYMFYYIKE